MLTTHSILVRQTLVLTTDPASGTSPLTSAAFRPGNHLRPQHPLASVDDSGGTRTNAGLGCEMNLCVRKFTRGHFPPPASDGVGLFTFLTRLQTFMGTYVERLTPPPHLHVHCFTITQQGVMVPAVLMEWKVSVP